MKQFFNVADFYAGKSVLLTGGTGFLGKVLMEKLLYSCPKLDKIYLLIREKNNSSPEDRLQSLFDQHLFTRLKKERAEDLKKIIPICGDISEENLGIQKEDEKILTEKVNVIIHSAATVRFVEPLKVAMNVNFEGTKRVLSLSKKITNLQKFVYISTAYSNSNRQCIEEVIYPPPASYNEVYRVMEKYDGDEEETKRLLGDRPNTYIFVKALAENYVAENHPNVPTIIIRPSIVSGSLNEPIKGWIDTWTGATGISTSIGLGYQRVVHGKPSNVIDLIPVDYFSNFTIVAAAKCNETDGVRVYNCCTSGTNPVTINYLSQTFINEAVRHKINVVPYPTITFSESQWIVSTIAFLTQLLPAFVLDCFLRMLGNEPRHVKKQKQILKVQSLLKHFTSNSWSIQSTQTQLLIDSLSDSDRETFPCDISSIKWSEYLPVYFNGVKSYLL